METLQIILYILSYIGIGAIIATIMHELETKNIIDFDIRTDDRVYPTIYLWPMVLIMIVPISIYIELTKDKE